jgi:hypothetical protein
MASMKTAFDIEGPLVIEINKFWQEVYCVISCTRFMAFRKIRDEIPASRTNKSDTIVIQFDFESGSECRRVKFGLAELSKIMKNGVFAETPFFFSITVREDVFMFAAGHERERSKWLIFIKTLNVRIPSVHCPD